MGKTNMGQTIRHRLLNLLYSQGIQGWGDISVSSRLAEYNKEQVATELAQLVDSGLVDDIGRGYKLSQRGSQHVANARAQATETTT